MNKTKKKSLTKILIFIFIIGIIGLGYLFKDNIPALNVFNENNNQTFLKAQEMGLFKDEYSNEYNNIDYIEDDDFITIINTLLDKNYTTDEINNIYKYLDKENIEKLINKDYLELSDFFNIVNFDVNNYERYINAIGEKATAVFQRDDLTISDVVTYVNIGLDKEFYSVFKKIENPDDVLTLVNKYNMLPTTYEPSDLEVINTPVTNPDTRVFKLRKVAKEAIELLLNDAHKAGYTMFPYSAYRSYSYQSTLYNNYIIRDGQKKADTYSARPGFSEHQLGLAVDLTSAGNSNSLTNKAFNWVAENAHNYGFIIRYPDNQIDITGYVYEDWHLRYLGIDVATDVKNKNLTYDEYYDLYVK